MLVGLAVLVAIGTVTGAIILRAGCWLYNKLAGGAGSGNSVAEPDFGKAMLICFVTSLVQCGVGVVAGIAGAGFAAQMGPTAVNLITLPLSFLTMAAMLSAMLPTTFVRGLLVALLQLVVCLIIAAVFLLPLWGFHVWHG
jgi:hypothetical protein